jgi:hypothetical protein
MVPVIASAKAAKTRRAHLVGVNAALMTST